MVSLFHELLPTPQQGRLSVVTGDLCEAFPTHLRVCSAAGGALQSSQRGAGPQGPHCFPGEQDSPLPISRGPGRPSSVPHSTGWRRRALLLPLPQKCPAILETVMVQLVLWLLKSPVRGSAQPTVPLLSYPRQGRVRPFSPACLLSHRPFPACTAASCPCPSHVAQSCSQGRVPCLGPALPVLSMARAPAGPALITAPGTWPST